MKNTISTFVVILSFITLSHAQNQSFFKIDTTVIGKLGFSKKNPWQLPLKDTIVVQNFDFRNPKNAELNLITSFDNMPIFIPDSNHSMPIYTPDTAVTYKKRVFNID